MSKKLDISVFDFEVLKQDWLVSFLNTDTKELKTIHNDTLSLIDFIEKKKRNTVFVGFNNKYFDNWCLKSIYYGVNPYKVVSNTINNTLKPWEIGELKYKKNIPGLITFDLMDVTTTALSLKEIEGNLGLDIVESTVDFNFSDKMNAQQTKEMTVYNHADVFATNEIYGLVKDTLEVKKSLCDMYNLPYENISKTLASLMGIILKTQPLSEQEDFYRYKTPTCIVLMDKEPLRKFEGHILTWTGGLEQDTFSFVHKIGNLDITFALGGCHGAKENFIMDINSSDVFVYADVKQMYPSLMANRENPEFRFHPRTIDNWSIISDLIDKRDELNKEGKTDWGTAIKLGCNVIYGSMLAKTRIFTDWINGRNVCITGQLCAAMLAEYLSKIESVELIQVNTDGIFFKIKPERINEMNTIVNIWENKLKLSLKCNIINSGKLVQKDVNNYILFNKKNNSIVTKGKEVNKWNGGNYRNNSASIVDEAIVKYFIYDKPINHTILEAFNKNEVIKFQLIFSRKGKNYSNTYWGNDIVQKVNRVFPTSNKKFPSLFKMKDGIRHKFPNVPEHCIVNNNKINNIKLEDMELDINYYLKLANDKIKKFRGDKK